MPPRGLFTMTSVLLWLSLVLLGPTPTTLGSRDTRSCCTSYSTKPVPFKQIKGFKVQNDWENCRIKAIIFYTLRNHQVCANGNDEWVRKSLVLLSSKLKKMAKARSAAGVKKVRHPSYTDGSGSFYSTTITYSNSTEAFY